MASTTYIASTRTCTHKPHTIYLYIHMYIYPETQTPSTQRAYKIGSAYTPLFTQITQFVLAVGLEARMAPSFAQHCRIVTSSAVGPQQLIIGTFALIQDSGARVANTPRHKCIYVYTTHTPAQQQAHSRLVL